jgi:hypothetical protein
MNYKLSILTILCCLFSAATVHAACNSNIPASTPNSQLTDNGDGTVTDNKTGLMWKQCLEGISGSNCTTGTMTIFTWQQALQRPGTVNTSGFAGYTDWRMPDIRELRSMIEKQCYNPAFNTTRFPNTPGLLVWSGSPVAGSSDGAWFVNFILGVSHAGKRSDFGAVRLVRGGQ